MTNLGSAVNDNLWQLVTSKCIRRA